MSDSNEFPRLVYRQSETAEAEVWGKKVDLREVADHDELEAAQAEGFTLRPDGANEEPVSEGPSFAILDEKAAVIIEHLPALTRDELGAILEAEQRGKTRKTVIEAIEAALAADPAAPAE